MKRLSTLLFTVLLALGLAACGGGGGGGGGGTTPDSAAGAYSDSLVSYKEHDYFNPTEELWVDNVERTADGIKITTFKGTEHTFLEADFSTANGFKKSPTVTLDTYYKHTIYLGGKELKLQYSEFGYWHVDDSGDYLRHSVALATGNFEREGKPRQDAAFTGTTVAIYTDSSPGKYIDTVHTGTAEMNYANAAQGWTLKLNFPNAFKITTTNIAMNSSWGAEYAGSFEQDDAAKTTVESLNASYHFYSTTPYHSSVEGQFYGADSTNASEAVGEFTLGYSTQIIEGTFGLKKK